MGPDDIVEQWRPHAGSGGLNLAFGMLIAFISRGLLTREEAHGILDEQASLLEDIREHAGFDTQENAHLSDGLQDLLYLRRMLQANPLTRLPD